jgi:hypothetical protein
MINLDELLASMEVQTNVLLEAKRVVEVKRRNITAMLQVDYNGLTCKAEGCFDKADFYGSKTHFCESHMLIKVGA